MRKNCLLLLLVIASMANAKVAFLKVSDSYPNYGDEQPEQKAYDWFVSTYDAEDVVTAIPADASTYKVLWINVDRNISESEFDALFPTDKQNALTNYVIAGGNLLLTKKASRLATLIGRISGYNPSWNNSGYSIGGDTWTINPILGQGKPDSEKRNAIGHPIFSDLSTAGNPYAYTTFPLVGAVNRSDDNIMWMAMNTSTHTYGNDAENEGELSKLTDFESDRNCQVLATWGQVTSYGFPTIIEFFPDNTYKGTIITIGAAAYQWGKSNTGDPLNNVKTLTSNALSYLDHNGTEIGYYMPYSLSEIYSTDAHHADFQTARWFYDNYVATNKGRFIHKGEDFPSGMKMLWVHNDRIGLGKEDFYTAFGGDTFKGKLKTFVDGGGNLYLTKQACYLAYKMDKIYEPDTWGNEGYEASNVDKWGINAKFIGKDIAGATVDRSSHPIFRGLTTVPSFTHNGNAEGYDYEMFPLVDGNTTTSQRTNNNTIWADMKRKNGTAQGNSETDKLTNFEAEWDCKVLGVWEHVKDFCAAGLIEFNPNSRGGKIIANGFSAYQWGDNNTDATAIGNVQKLSSNIVQYLYMESSLKDCPNCFPVY